MRRWLIGLLFLLSGATALCYQVAWTRHLVLLFGNTSHAIALILAAYMLGLAVGSEAGGRWADRTRRPAVVYAVKKHSKPHHVGHYLVSMIHKEVFRKEVAW